MDSTLRPNRPRLQLLLLSVTLCTLALAGGIFWEEGPTESELVAFGWNTPTLATLGRLLLLGLPYALWTLAILGAHEMGHYLTCRYYGIPATLPFFLPGIPPLGSFGAVIRIRGPIPDRKALFDVAAAGPIAGFAVALPLLAAGLLRAEPFTVSASEGAIYLGQPVAALAIQDLLRPNAGDLRVNGLIGAGWVGMLVTSLNLFPVGQLDGGHAAYAFSPRVHRALTRLTLLGVLALVVVQVVVFRQLPAYGIWFLILLWMRDRHPRLLDESGGIGPGRKLIAALLVAIFVLSFIFVPVHFDDP